MQKGEASADLFSLAYNQAGDLAFGSMKVSVKKVGSSRELARLESKIGVYGEGLQEH